MPLKKINYQNLVIYKLCCKDVNVKDIYIGSTTNFTSRKREHKKNCNKETSKEYNQYKYQFIRNNGGWDNWDMILIEKYPCNDNLEARKKETEFVNLLKASLNKELPYQNKIEYHKKYLEEGRHKLTNYYNEKVHCECGFISCKRTFKRHLKNKLHLKNLEEKNSSTLQENIYIKK